MISTEENESITDVKKYIRKIIQYARYRKISPDRITFAIERSDSHITRLARFLRSAELPKCENCEIMKGSDTK